MQQIIIADGIEGGVTFAGFKDPTQAAEAYKAVKLYSKSNPRPTEAACFGNYVVVIQCSKPDPAIFAQFAKKITDAIGLKAK